MDTDGDGLLSKAELVAAVADLGLPLSDATALWKAFDPDGVGALTLKALDRTLRRAAADGGDGDEAAALPRPPTVQTGRLATRRRSL